MSDLLIPTHFSFDGLPPQQLNSLTDQMESELRAQGLEAGHILAIFLPTGVQFIAALFAAMRIGAVFCPLNTKLPEQAIQAQLAQLKPKIYLSAAGIKNFEAPPTTLLPSSFLLFTSGSTGTPKIVNLSLQNFLAAATSAIDVCNFTKGDTWLLSLPLYHVGGLSILFRALLAGAAVVTDGTSSTITHLSNVPTQLYRSWPIYPRLKVLLLSGAPTNHIPERLPIIAAYGMTETASMMIGQKNARVKDDSIYLGLPHSGKEMILNAEGEILVRGDSLFQGYWDGIQLHTPGAWFATGDLGRFDPQLGFAIVGRKDNQFISGGENIQPEEIEKELLFHPAILEAIVIPQPDEEFGFRPVAYLRTAEKTDPNQLKNFLSERLPKYKIPVAFFSLEKIAEVGMKVSRKKLFESLTSK